MAGGGGGVDDNTAQGGHLIADTAATVTAKWAKGTGGPAGDEVQNLVGINLAQIKSGENRSNPQSGDPQPPLATTEQAAVATGGSVTHALTSEGADASEDGTGRRTPVIAFGHTNGLDVQASEHVTPTLRAGHDVGGGSVMTPIDWQGGSNQDQVVTPDATSPTLAHSSNAHGGHHQPKVMESAAVRRLTPTECERLQGYPDGWTAYSHGRPQADSARYRQLGNSYAVPVVEWIARRIVGWSA